jgi:hypothetical protein
MSTSLRRHEPTLELTTRARAMHKYASPPPCGHGTTCNVCQDSRDGYRRPPTVRDELDWLRGRRNTRRLREAVLGQLVAAGQGSALGQDPGGREIGRLGAPGSEMTTPTEGALGGHDSQLSVVAASILGRSRLRAASSARSTGRYLTRRWSWRSRMRTWWRRTTSSMSLSTSRRQRETTSARTRQSATYPREKATRPMLTGHGAECQLRALIGILVPFRAESGPRSS